MFYAAQLVSRDGPLQVLWVAATLDRQLNRQLVDDTAISRMVDVYLAPDAPAGIFSAGPRAGAAGGRRHKTGRGRGSSGGRSSGDERSVTGGGGDAAPLALRLSGQLLLGVCRIYSRQVAYLLQDCEKALLVLKNIRPIMGVPLAYGASDQPGDSVARGEGEAKSSLLRTQSEDSGGRRAAAAVRGRRRAAVTATTAAAAAAGATGGALHIGPLMEQDDDDDDDEEEILLEGGSGKVAAAAITQTSLPQTGSLALLLDAPGSRTKSGGNSAGHGGLEMLANMPYISPPYMARESPWGDPWSSALSGSSGGGGMFRDPIFTAATTADDRNSYFEEVPDHFEFDLYEHEIEALRTVTHEPAKTIATAAAPKVGADQDAFTTPPPNAAYSRRDAAEEAQRWEDEAGRVGRTVDSSAAAVEAETPTPTLAAMAAVSAATTPIEATAGILMTTAEPTGTATEGQGGGEAEMESEDDRGSDEENRTAMAVPTVSTGGVSGRGTYGTELIDGEARRYGGSGESSARHANDDGDSAAMVDVVPRRGDGGGASSAAAAAETTLALTGEAAAAEGAAAPGSTAAAVAAAADGVYSARVPPPPPPPNPRTQQPGRAAALRIQAALAVAPTDSDGGATAATTAVEPGGNGSDEGGGGRSAKKKRSSMSPGPTTVNDHAGAGFSSPAAGGSGGGGGAAAATDGTAHVAAEHRSNGSGGKCVTADVDREGRLRVTLPTHAVRELLQDRSPLLNINRRKAALNRLPSSGLSHGDVSDGGDEAYFSPWLAAWFHLTGPGSRHNRRTPNDRNYHINHQHQHHQRCRGGGGRGGAGAVAAGPGSAAAAAATSKSWLLPERLLDVAAGPASVPAPALAPVLQHLFLFLAGRRSSDGEAQMPGQGPPTRGPRERLQPNAQAATAAQPGGSMAPKTSVSRGHEGGWTGSVEEACVGPGLTATHGLASPSDGRIVSRASGGTTASADAATCGGCDDYAAADTANGAVASAVTATVDGGGGAAVGTASLSAGVEPGSEDGGGMPSQECVDPDVAGGRSEPERAGRSGQQPQQLRQRQQQTQKRASRERDGDEERLEAGNEQDEEEQEEEEDGEETMMIVEDAGASELRLYGDDENLAAVAALGVAEEAEQQPGGNAAERRQHAAADGFTARTQNVLWTLQALAASARRMQRDVIRGSAKRRRLETQTESPRPPQPPQLAEAEVAFSTAGGEEEGLPLTTAAELLRSASRLADLTFAPPAPDATTTNADPKRHLAVATAAAAGEASPLAPSGLGNGSVSSDPRTGSGDAVAAADAAATAGASSGGNSSGGYSRMAAARTFYDLLVLSNRGYISLRTIPATTSYTATPTTAAAATATSTLHPTATAITTTAAGGSEDGDVQRDDDIAEVECVGPEQLVVVARPRLIVAVVRGPLPLHRSGNGERTASQSS